MCSDLLRLIYPRICAACHHALAGNEEVLCSFCLFYLPRTHFHLHADNELERHFWGRVPLRRATAFCYFQKGSRLQRLIHQLKYEGRTDIGRYLGKLYGLELLQSAEFQQVDLLLPVPLHRSRLLQRGYNQADCICQGMAEALQKPWSDQVLIRRQATDSQTRKNRFERWENVADVFAVARPAAVAGKHLLLIDDVITTGSTLEAAAHSLLQYEAASVSVAGIGCAIR
ncbi:MAG: ComF family protein [Chitinophagales bacterium]|nr:ComF family protein [Chitinophagales bacterium]MDW8393035.1 ComF family protein [Chitinophagales bacterium]